MNQIMKADLHTYISSASEDIEVVRKTLKELSNKNTSNIYMLMDASHDPLSLYVFGQEFIPAFFRELYLSGIKNALIDAYDQVNNDPNWNWEEIYEIAREDAIQHGIDPDKVIKEWESEQN